MHAQASAGKGAGPALLTNMLAPQDSMDSPPRSASRASLHSASSRPVSASVHSTLRYGSGAVLEVRST